MRLNQDVRPYQTRHGGRIEKHRLVAFAVTNNQRNALCGETSQVVRSAVTAELDSRFDAVQLGEFFGGSAGGGFDFECNHRNRWSAAGKSDRSVTFGATNVYDAVKGRVASQLDRGMQFQFVHPKKLRAQGTAERAIDVPNPTKRPCVNLSVRRSFGARLQVRTGSQPIRCKTFIS